MGNKTSRFLWLQQGAGLSKGRWGGGSASDYPQLRGSLQDYQRTNAFY